MRDILFRGKRSSDCKWVYGNYIKSPTCKNLYMIEDTEPTIMDSGDRHFIGCPPVDPATVGQYTGLTDKNGERIFEGDIIKVTWCVVGRKPVVSYLFVEFAKGIFETKRIKDNKPYGMVSTYVSKEVGDCGVFCEVIGNIHDNPELMEVQSDG